MPNKNKKINVAVIGVGNMGKHHARNYASLKNVRLVAICDIDQKFGKVIAKKHNAKFYTDYKKMVKSEKIDAVSIAAPTNLHRQIAGYCLKNNIHALVEKPLAQTIMQAEYLTRLAKKNNLILLTGHIEQYNPAIIKLQELIKGGDIGDMLSIVIKRVGLFPPQIKDVNVVTDIAVHDLDIVKTLTGSFPRSIFANGSGGLTNGRIDHAEIFLDYGVFGCFIQVNWVTPIKIREISVTGTKGFVSANYITQEVNFFKSKYKKLQHKGFNEYIIKFGEPQPTPIKIKREEPLKIELSNFINSILKAEEPKVSMQQAIDAIYLTQQTVKSIHKDNNIKINR